MKSLIYVAIGGAIGAVMRYGISSGIYSWFGRSFPYGTLVVNLLGSFAIGLFSILLIEKFNVSHELRLALVVGVLGALTTFSTFSWDTLDLMQQGLMQRAFLNVLLNVVLCITAAWAGAQLARNYI